MKIESRPGAEGEPLVSWGFLVVLLWAIAATVLALIGWLT